MVLHVENILCVENVDDKVVILENLINGILENLINGILDRLAPYKIFVISNKSATPSIAGGTLEKIDAYKDSFNKSGNKKYWEGYKFLRHKVTSVMRTSQKKVFNDCINSKVSSSKDFYNAAKKVTCCTQQEK